MKKVIISIPADLNTIVEEYSESHKKRYPTEKKPSKAEICVLAMRKGLSWMENEIDRMEHEFEQYNTLSAE